MMAILIATTIAMIVASVLLSSRAENAAAFYSGKDARGVAPGVMALTLSQVTTWIFARSIMNAAILGYFYGIGGALAYAAYYLSFVTGAAIVDSLRFRHGYNSIQQFLADRFGLSGPAAYNFVTGVRLLSEVFANLLVIGAIFGAAGTLAYTGAVIAIAVSVLAYAGRGGLHAAIRTDVLQMVVFLAVLAVLIAASLTSGVFDFEAIAASSPAIDNPGWVLLAVALLQVWSYPMHDPVMMDRGLIADRATTRASFLHAAWVSVLCIMAFGVIGTMAGIAKLPGEDLMATFTRVYGIWPVLLFNIALIISCMSTLDSTLASASKLAVVDMGTGAATTQNGRIAMALFMAGGTLMVFVGSKDLFSAVAVSGTASMFLAPVVFFSLWLGWRDVPTWSYLTAFAAAMAGATLYFVEASGYSSVMGALTGLEHKYAKLLVICVAVMVIGCGAFVLGRVLARSRPAPSTG
ncbi:MAG: sodium:proline symporter [Pseudomonadota bacterium]